MKKKIAILGGGLSSLSAAYELSDYPGWENDYEITVYQMGWRLGGKTAASRGPNGRIEERGIHILQGWYANEFRMLRDAYGTIKDKKLAPNSPFKDWDDAIKPDPQTLLTEWSPSQRKWINWPLVFPMNDQVPGSEEPVTMKNKINEAMAVILELIIGSPFSDGKANEWLEEHYFEENNKEEEEKEEEPTSFFGKVVDAVEDAAEAVVETVEDVVEGIAKKTIQVLILNKLKKRLEAAMNSEELSEELIDDVLEVIDDILDWADDSNFLEWLIQGDDMRRIWTMIEFGLVNLKGVLIDVYNTETHKFEWNKINSDDYKHWLKSHGGSELLLDSAIVRFMYYGSFANLYQGNPGTIGADIAVRMVIATVNYKGSFVWKLVAGTADTIISPLYLVLKDRGVKFEFFQKVEQVNWSATGEIESISMAEQVKLKDGLSTYDPTIEWNGITSWPDRPLYDQLDPTQAKELEERKIDLESSWTDWKDYRQYKMTKGNEFDEIILGISVAALKEVCSSICENNTTWKNMVEKVATTQTFGVQVWMEPTLTEMGFIHSEWGIKDGTDPNSVIYNNPIYSWTSMDVVLPWEGDNPNHEPGHLDYYCGTIADEEPMPPYTDTDFPARQVDRLKNLTEQWLHDNMGWFYPKLTTDEWPQGFDFIHMYNYNPEGTSRQERFDSQFFTMNIDPTNRYVLAHPGTDQYRLKANESQFSNMFLCGDWTDFGLNVGHMEGTVISGLKAAQDMMLANGFPKDDLKPILDSE